jgi:hypothetical protein
MTHHQPQLVDLTPMTRRGVALVEWCVSTRTCADDVTVYEMQSVIRDCEAFIRDWLASADAMQGTRR